MKAIYGAQEVLLLMSYEDWLKTSSADDKNGRRSPQLGAVDRALRTLELAPTVQNLKQLASTYGLWVTGHQKTAKTLPAVNLKKQLDVLLTRLKDRDTLIRRLNGALDVLDWRRRCLCAELFKHNIELGQANEHVDVLAAEARLSSGWANGIQEGAALDFWTAKGALEQAALAQWPALTLKARMVMQSQKVIQPNAAWPPWGALFMRRGLYCHSAAALAAQVVNSSRGAAQAGHTCSIRSLDVIHQQPPQTGQLTHWWVAVNRPDRLEFGDRVVRFRKKNDYEHLEICGGFVVDLWGALWLAQVDNAAAYAAANLTVQEECIRSQPFIGLGGNNDALRSYTHHVY